MTSVEQISLPFNQMPAGLPQTRNRTMATTESRNLYHDTPAGQVHLFVCPPQRQ